jgi:hypothetical protein
MFLTNITKVVIKTFAGFLASGFSLLAAGKAPVTSDQKPGARSLEPGVRR